jgi:uncharacterized integral membrane protein
MKKVKTVVWVLIVAFVAVVISQNKQFFLETKQSLAINLPFVQIPPTPEVALIYIFGAFFVGGLLFGLYLLIARGLKTKKKIKALKTQLKEEAEKSVTLEEELRSLRVEPVLPNADAPPAPELQTAGTNPGEGEKQ